MRLLSAVEVPAALPMDAAVELMRKAFRTISDGGAVVTERQVLPLENGTGLLMGHAVFDLFTARAVFQAAIDSGLTRILHEGSGVCSVAGETVWSIIRKSIAIAMV